MVRLTVRLVQRGRGRWRPRDQLASRLVGLPPPPARPSHASVKLLGIDAPERIETSVVEVTQEDVALAKLVREAQASAAVAEQQLLGGTK